MKISATDPDGDQISLGTISRPTGAIFIDHGNGQGDFSWRPDYMGPNSADGSPFDVTFWASDGLKSTSMNVQIVVTNRNRAPYVVSPDTVKAVAGETVSFDISGMDPDNDLTEWKTVSLPSQAVFSNGTGGHFVWNSSYKDSGLYHIKVALVDQYGASDTSDIILRMAAAEIYALSIDTTSAYPAELAKINVNLANLEPISGFNIVINYDAGSLNLVSITNIGTRSASFEYFSYVLNYRGLVGDILFAGLSDLASGPVTADLGAGSGAIIAITFYVTNDLNFSGFAVPVEFAFRDGLIGNDNTLTDTSGNRIGQASISYYSGSVQIKKSPDGSLGDINLNGIPYEIGDVVYFTNYFISPSKYPLDPVQRANSDVNKDGIAASIADLVYLVNHLVSPNSSSKPRYDLAPVEVAQAVENGGYELYYRASEELGAVAITLESSGMMPDSTDLYSDLQDQGLLFKSHIEGNLVRLLIYSETGRTMPSGTNRVLHLENGNNLKLKEMQTSSADGYLVPVTVKDGLSSVLPTGFELYQNSPNPFNPSTEISFDLPKADKVSLVIYNLLGQEVRKLVDMPLGGGHHTVTWDGRDNRGETVSSGIYLYRLVTASHTAQKKMVLLK